jgi:hypothetical protein
LSLYENIGYDNFKILERSCPADVLVKRVTAYSERRFDGNLYQLVAPIAAIKKVQNVSFLQRLRMTAIMMKPHRVKISALLRMKRYSDLVIPHKFDRLDAPVYIDNRSLDGFIENLPGDQCASAQCASCTYCRSWTDKAVIADESFRRNGLNQSERLTDDLLSGAHWI